MRPIRRTLYGSLSLVFSSAVIAVGAAAPAPQVEWAERYRLQDAERSTPAAMALGPSDTVYVTGWSRGNKLDDITTVKYSNSGGLLWTASYDGPLHVNDTSVALAVDADGSVCVTGYSFGMDSGNDCLTVKYGADGQELWVARYDGPAHSADLASSVAIGSDGSVYVGGTSSNGSLFDSDAVLIKYDAAGTQEWAFRRNGTANLRDGVVALSLTDDGGAYLVGEANGSNANTSDFFTCRVEANGNETWYREYAGPVGGRDAAIGVAVDPADNAIVTGSVRDPGGFSDTATLKYSPAGDLLWTATRDGLAHETDGPAGVAAHSDGTIYVAGVVTDRPGDYDVGIARYSPDGKELWASRFRSPGAGEDEVSGFCLDSSGSVYLTGASRIGDRVYQLTLKYGPSGQLAWAARYGSAATGDHRGYAVAVDSGRDVVVSGHSIKGNSSSFLTLKYRGPNAAPIAAAGPDRTLVSSSATADALLDASASTDPDGDALSYRWREGSRTLGEGQMVTAPLDQGRHVITLEVEDGRGAVDRDQVRINVGTPPSTAGARVTGSGAFPTTGGEGRFSVNARATANGRVIGSFTYTRPDGSRLKTGALSSLVTEGDTATVYGSIQVLRRQSVFFVLTLQDLGEPGAGVDTFRLELADGSGPITGVLASGNVAVTP